jgi:hypothetical protein
MTAGGKVSEKKYVVPQGMLDAAVSAAYEHNAGTEESSTRPGKVRDDIRASVQSSLEAALKWQAENLQIPTPRQTEEILKTLDWKGHRVCSDPPHWVVAGVVAEWHRHMYLEPEIRPHIRTMFAGLTLTCAEADYIVEELNRVAHGWSKP